MSLTTFAKEIDEGLSQNTKSLPSKYFYDKPGNKLFAKIMELPEYYLTRCEFEIFSRQSTDILKAIQLSPNNYFELIELGVGNGMKTKELLKVLDAKAYRFDFFPIDISKNALDSLEKNLSDELSNISVKKKQGDYFEILDFFKNTPHPKVVLFLSSNIGNMDDETATQFIQRLGKALNPNDKLIVGVDLIKPASIVLPAYNDKEGVTREFNINLLRRINNELDGNFDLNSFRHVPEYFEKEGIAKSYLESTKEQKVTIAKIGKTYAFKKGERIFTEISRKYNDAVLKKIIRNSRFKITNKLTDSKNYFANYILNRE